MLSIFNSLSGEKAPFKPIEPNKVRMYVCGMTVYDLCHIGHARMVMVFDFVVRYLRYAGYEVVYVRNITDIDDKIIQRAQENGESIQVLTARTIAQMHEDFAALGILPPDIEPRATETIPEICDLIQTLLDKNLAYQAKSGDVMYRVAEFNGYGKLSKKRIEDLRAGERIAVNADKEDPMDFVMWKASKADEPAWDSPFGAGRPGWHIECSAMSQKHLGKTFDIHGGGMDLKFPHHENEIAQSEGAHECQYVNTWMHNGFVNVDDEKMSKSLGNFFTIRDVLAHYNPEVLRCFMLSTHYRRPINYSDSALDMAKKTVDKLYTALRDTNPEQGMVIQSYQQRFAEAMNDDFNTPEAMVVWHELATELNKAKQGQSDKTNDLAKTLQHLCAAVGFLQQPVGAYLGLNSSDTEMSDADAEVQQMVEARDQARADRNFAKADELRDQLQAMDIVLEDSPNGTIWRRA